MQLKVKTLASMPGSTFEKHLARVKKICDSLKDGEIVSNVELQAHLHIGNTWYRIIKHPTMRAYTHMYCAGKGRFWGNKKTIAKAKKM